MIERDPNLMPDALKAKQRERINAIFNDQFHEDLHYIYYRAIYEKQKPLDHKVINKAIKKIITPEMIREARKALHDPNDKEFANRLRDMGEGLQAIEDRMTRKKK